MNALVKMLRGNEAVERAPVDLEGKLVWLSRLGKVRVGQYGEDGTWHAHIEMHVSAVGASFAVKSDFKQPSPTVAVDQLIERVRDTLAKMTR